MPTSETQKSLFSEGEPIAPKGTTPKVDPKAAAAALDARRESFKRSLASLEFAQRVTNDIMRLEFRI